MNSGYCIGYVARDQLCITEMSLLSTCHCSARGPAQSTCPSMINTFVDSHWMFSRCIFEKHCRGHNLGSKSVIPSSEVPSFIFGRLSEASKMPHHLEKGLNAAKLKQVEASTSPYALLLTCVHLSAMLLSTVLQPLNQYGSSGVFILVAHHCYRKCSISSRQLSFRWR